MPKLRPLNWSPWGLVTCLCPFLVTGNGHGRIPSPTWYMIEAFGTHADGQIIRGMTLLITNEMAGFVVFWAWHLGCNYLKIWSNISTILEVSCSRDMQIPSICQCHIWTLGMSSNDRLLCIERFRYTHMWYHIGSHASRDRTFILFMRGIWSLADIERGKGIRGILSS